MRNIILLFISIVFVSCNLQKDLDLNLPQYEVQLVTECYLEPGKPFRLTLIESTPYFGKGSGTINYINDADVTITHKGTSYKLVFDLANIIDTATGKLSNYYNAQLVPFDYDSTFTLTIKDKLGRIINANATIKRPVEIETVDYSFTSDSMVFLLTSFVDNPMVSNFYRLQVYDSLRIKTEAVVDFVLQDLFTTNNKVTVGGPPIYTKNDTVMLRLYHIDQEYNDFLESLQAAQGSFGNPFAQPATVKSGVEGGIGIFTGLSYSTKFVILKP